MWEVFLPHPVQWTSQSVQKLSFKYTKKNDPTSAETKNDKLDALLGVFDCSHVASAELFSAEFGQLFTGQP